MGERQWLGPRQGYGGRNARRKADVEGESTCFGAAYRSCQPLTDDAGPALALGGSMRLGRGLGRSWTIGIVGLQRRRSYILALRRFPQPVRRGVSTGRD